MDTYNKGKRTALLPVITGLVCIAVLVSLFFALKLYKAQTDENERLALELEQSRMETAVRTLSGTLRSVQTEKDRNEKQSTAERRLQLKNAYLENDREALITLVNPWNTITDDYEPHLTELGDGMLLDERAAGALEEMLKACKAAGGAPCPISGYRTQEYQQELFDNKVMRLMSSGYTADNAPAKAAESVAVPGTSEHQLGLAMDIVDEYYPELDYAQEWTGTQQWLIQHCTEYGFILRYPSESSEITGIIFEPWHYRYVGKTAAKKIAELGITFEEYISSENSTAA